MYYLFVVMFLHNGAVAVHKYPDEMKYLECMQYARSEASEMRKEDTSDFKTIDFYCGTDEDFKKKYNRKIDNE